jgi:hypothetical protein
MAVARALALAVVPVALALGCGERGQSAADRLQAAIAAHAAGKDEPSDQEIEALFLRLDADVANARADAVEAEGDARAAAEARARDLEQRRAELTTAYLDAKIARAGDAAAKTVRAVGRQIGAGIEDAGRRMRESLGDPDAPPATE